MGLFDKFRQGLQKTAQLLKTDVRDLFRTQGRLVDDAFIEEVFEWLIKRDLGVQAAREIADEVNKTYRSRVVERLDVVNSIKQKLKEILAQPEDPIRFAAGGPTVVMICGVNGSGKTTSIAKLTHLLRSPRKRAPWLWHRGAPCRAPPKSSTPWA